MKPLKHLILAAAMALGALSAAEAQVYPTTNPVYIPTAQKSASTFTSTGNYDFNTAGVGTVSVRVVKAGGATYTGALQCSNDGTNFTTIPAVPVAGGTAVTSMTASGFWLGSVAGCTVARFNVSAVGGAGGLTVQMAGAPGTSATPLLSGASVAPAAATTGGGSMAHVLSAATTNSTSVKGSAGTLYTVTATNTNATTAYLKFYDKATAPTCASDTVSLTFALLQNVPRTIDIPVGAAFASGIGLCITGAAADNDNTAATTGIVVSVVYK